jgi:hypothetical protein
MIFYKQYLVCSNIHSLLARHFVQNIAIEILERLYKCFLYKHRSKNDVLRDTFVL